MDDTVVLAESVEDLVLFSPEWGLKISRGEKVYGFQQAPLD